MGKIEIKNIKKIIEKHKDDIVKDNGLGWDYSKFDLNGITVVGKIEPMVYYNFLEPVENSKLSVLFGLNDFLTSGLMPELALVDFESVGEKKEDFIEYVENIILELGKRGIKLLAAHTGDYGNISQGVSGSIALISLNKKPKYSPEKIPREYGIFVSGTLGLEYRYFMERKIGIKDPKTFPEDLSVENILKCLNNKVYYVHDLSEGGLFRGLMELTEMLGHGFNIEAQKIEAIKIPELSAEKVIEASSSGAIIIIADSNYAPPKNCKIVRLETAENGIFLDGQRFIGSGDIILDLFKNK